MNKRFWVLALTICAVLALCVSASAEKTLKADDPLKVFLSQPTAMVVDKPFQVNYAITGGVAPYDVFIEVTHNGRYVDSFNGNKRSTFTPDEPGLYVVTVTVTDAEGTQVAARFNITAYTANTLDLTAVNIAEGSDGKSIVTTVQYNVGQDNAIFTYKLYDDSDALLATSNPTPESSYTFLYLAPGTYYVVVDVGDGYTTDSMTSAKLTIGLHPDLRVAEKALHAWLSSDQKSIFIDRPTASGGTGSYTFAYTCYNDASRPMNYFYDSSSTTVAMTPGTGGRYCVFCTVSDDVTHEAITLHTDWFTLPSTHGPLTVSTPLAVRTSSTRREIIATQPTISGGTGSYAVFYSCYNGFGQNVAFFASLDVNVAIPTNQNGHFCVTCVVTDGVETVYSVSPWIDLDGYPQRPPMNVGNPTASVSGDNRSIYVTKPNITGGTGTYQLTYTCFDDLGRTVAYFSSTASSVAVTPGFNGRFLVRVTVTDGVETFYVDTGWSYLSGYTALPEPEI